MTSARAQHAADELNRFAERVGMPGRCDPALGFQNPELNDATTLWRNTANGRPLPLRSEMTARALKPFLPNVALVDLVQHAGACRFRMRLMGTALASLLGDHTGQFVDEAIVSPFHERWNAIFGAAIAAGEPLRVFGRLEYRRLDHIAIELMVAPLCVDGPLPSSVLVVAHIDCSGRHVFEPLVRNRISGRAPAL
jgi:hypothetical protein